LKDNQSIDISHLSLMTAEDI